MSNATRTALLALALVCAPLPRAARSQVPAGPSEDAARDVRVCGGGDVTLGTNLDTSWVITASRRSGIEVPAYPDPDSLLAPLRPLVEDADVLLLNVEGAIGRGRAPRKCRPGSTMCFAFRMPAHAADALRRVGGSAEVVGNVANNHARDAGPGGLVQTVERLQAADVHVTGADTVPTVVVTGAGDTVAFLGFAHSGAPNDVRDLETVRRVVERTAREHRRVVVTMHIGGEGARATRTRDAMERFAGATRGNPVAFARTAVEAGADLVIGHGPHVLRAIEWRGDALVAYSLGNLLTYGPFLLTPPIDRGAIVCASLDANGRVADASLRPTRQQPPGLVEPDAERRAIALVDSLSARDFPTTGARVLEDGTIARRGPIPVTKDRPGAGRR